MNDFALLLKSVIIVIDGIGEATELCRGRCSAIIGGKSEPSRMALDGAVRKSSRRELTARSRQSRRRVGKVRRPVIESFGSG